MEQCFKTLCTTLATSSMDATNGAGALKVYLTSTAGHHDDPARMHIDVLTMDSLNHLRHATRYFIEEQEISMGYDKCMTVFHKFVLAVAWKLYHLLKVRLLFLIESILSHGVDVL